MMREKEKEELLNKRKRDIEELKECTFKPKTQPLPKPVLFHINRLINRF